MGHVWDRLQCVKLFKIFCIWISYILTFAAILKIINIVFAVFYCLCFVLVTQRISFWSNRSVERINRCLCVILYVPILTLALFFVVFWSLFYFRLVLFFNFYYKRYSFWRFSSDVFCRQLSCMHLDVYFSLGSEQWTCCRTSIRIVRMGSSFWIIWLPDDGPLWN